VLDLGTGTGSLARAAAARWPGARVVGLDASASMLSVARRATESSTSGLGPGMGQLEWIVADAAAMPLADASVDVVLCAFMLHLVADRIAVLLEVGRVLRPTGILGLVTWLADETVMAPDVEFDEAVYDLRLDDPEADVEAQPPDDIASPEELRADLAACGFHDVDAQADGLVHAWTQGEYLEFKMGYDEWDLFASLSSADRGRLRERLVERWASLPEEVFTLRAPLVMATARPQAAKGDISRGRHTRQGR
jgi:SAM-dependent methyltransferase